MTGFCLAFPVSYPWLVASLCIASGGPFRSCCLYTSFQWLLLLGGQNPLAGLKCSLCSGSACLLSHLSSYSAQCSLPAKLEGLLVPESIPCCPISVPLLQLFQLESSCYPLNWMCSPSDIARQFYLSCHLGSFFAVSGFFLTMIRS